MRRIKHIIIGWGKKWGFLPTSEAELKLSELRLTICTECPEHKTSRILEWVTDNDAEYVDRIFCSKCHCPCSAKTIVVNERCPLGKW